MKSPVWEINLIQDPFTAKIPDCDGGYNENEGWLSYPYVGAGDWAGVAVGMFTLLSQHLIEYRAHNAGVRITYV